jgi:cell division protein FtsZ
MIEEMNDLNDFMSKFDKRYELKWGYGTNPSLGDKIKVTILATGFGLSDINEEMANRAKQTAIEDIAKIAEEEELKAKAAARRGRYYGKEAQNAPQKRRPNIYYFSAADLDNEDLILAVEDTPTYGRLRQTLEEITRLSVDYHKNEEENAEQGKDDNSGVIKFS